MGEYSRDEALAFIESMRLTVADKTGFRWLGDKLSRLAGYVDGVSAENELLNGFVDQTGVRDEFEAYRAAHTGEDS